MTVRESRDPKGLYRRARPDLVLDGTRPIEEGVAALESLLRERGVL